MDFRFRNIVKSCAIRKKTFNKPKFYSCISAVLCFFLLVGCGETDHKSTAPTDQIVTETVVKTTVAETTPPETIEPTSEPETVAPTTDPDETSTPEATEEPTTIPATEYNTEPATEPEVIVPPTAKATEPKEEMVWIPTNGGKKYHSRSSCSNMNGPRQVTISQAKAKGFTPCKRCH